MPKLYNVKTKHWIGFSVTPFLLLITENYFYLIWIEREEKPPSVNERPVIGQFNKEFESIKLINYYTNLWMKDVLKHALKQELEEVKNPKQFLTHKFPEIRELFRNVYTIPN